MESCRIRYAERRTGIARFETEVAQLDATTAALAVSLFAVFNGLGRPLFGALTDKLGPKHTAVISFAMTLSASLLLFFFGQGNSMLYLFAFCVLWMCLGGWLAIAPTATGMFFGKLHYAQNYGVVFTAYGAGAILGTLLSGSIKDITGSYLHVFPIVAGLVLFGMLIAAIGLNGPAAPAPCEYRTHSATNGWQRNDAIHAAKPVY